MSLCLKNKNYFLYFIAQIISKFGDVLFHIAVMWYLLDSRDSLVSVGIAAMMKELPQLLFGFVSGVLVDKLNRKKLMIISDGISGTLTLGLTMVMFLGWENNLLIYVLIFALGVMDTVYSPATRCFIRQIVNDEELVAANSLYNSISEVISVIGIAISGVLISWLGCFNVFVFNGITYVLGALLIMLIPYTQASSRENQLFSRKDVALSLRWIRNSSFTKAFIICIAISNIAYSIIYMMPSVLSKNVLGSGVGGYSMIECCVSLGMIVGAGFIGMKGIRRAGLFFVIGSILGAVLMMTMSQVDHILITMLIYFLFGISDAITIPVFTYLQITIPNEMQGRVYALIDIILMSVSPIGSFIVSCIIEQISLEVLFVISGFVLLIVAVYGYFNKAFFRSEIGSC